MWIHRLDHTFAALADPRSTCRSGAAPRKNEVFSCELGFHPGGAWRIVHRGPDGGGREVLGEFFDGAGHRRDISIRPEAVLFHGRPRPFEHLGDEHIQLETRRGSRPLGPSTCGFAS